MRYFLFCFAYFIINLSILAQENNYVPNQYLVQLRPHQTIEQLTSKLQHYNNKISWKTPERLVPNMEIWLLEHLESIEQSNPNDLLHFLSSLSIVQVAQFNHYAELRSPNTTPPNDPLFSNQWQYVNGGGANAIDLDADLAWDITTGGLTATNDTIVVAILDNGISTTQPDFGDNLWYNYNEIPNNGIDDDNNGYVDDYRGWNSTAYSDMISGIGHGTSVAGIVGAKGNNGQGVTGVNWNVKLMIIKNDQNLTEARIIAAYGYALTHRRLYNESNGQKGAYVVATNASWGKNYGKPSDEPLWCAFYDTLGAYGILNVAATANLALDVEVEGDMPTRCPSDYLVAVTNINNLGYKEVNAAYGNISIDLGAFGSGVYTTTTNGYGTFGGTSGASPHVAGAVALLYSGACANFMAYSKIYPDSAALKMKKYLLDGVIPNVDLINRTVSGGHLNLFNSLNECINDCPANDCFVPYQIYISNSLDTSVQLNWTSTASVNQLKYRYRIQNGTWNFYNHTPLSQHYLTLNNLVACTFYEVEFISICNNTQSDTILYTFKTNGCCDAPAGFIINTITSDSCYLNWQALFASSSYLLEYKETNSSSWQVLTSATPAYALSNLNPCTNYEARLRAICSSGDTTLYTDTLHFITVGCLSCNSLNYCVAIGAAPDDDFIDTFAVDNQVFATGNNNGYAFFGANPILLGKGDYHNISISQGKSYLEYVKIWLDINQDGDFNDANELLYSTIMASVDKTKKGSFIVPATALLGITRMRVGMRWNDYPLVCDTTDYGEIEDYCVQIIQGNSVSTIQKSPFELQIAPNPFMDELTLFLKLEQTSDLSLTIFTITGQVVFEKSLPQQAAGEQKMVLRPNLENGVYLLQVRGDDGVVTKRVARVE